MRQLYLAITLALFSIIAQAAWVEGYTRDDGIYVPGHWSDDNYESRNRERDLRQQQEERDRLNRQYNSPQPLKSPTLEENLYGDQSKRRY